MNLLIFIIFAFGLQAFCLYIGARSARNIKTSTDYYLAGRGVRFFPLMMTFIATQVGGGLALGSAEEAYLYGWSVLAYPLGAALGLLILGMGIGRKLMTFKVSTIAQIFEVFYGSVRLKQVASILSIISLFMILVAQVIASHKFMVALGVQNFLWFILLWAMIIFYTSAGGFKAVVSTDVIQASFFIVIFIGAFAYSILFADQPVSIPFEINMVGEGAVSSGKLFGWLFMPLLFMIIEQDMGQRCFAAESGSTVSKATFFAGICTILICSIPVFFGVLARNLNLSIPEGASVLMTAIQTTTSPIVAALVGAAVLAAIISTADSLINAISSNISQDFDIKLIKSKTILSSQMLTALVASVGVAFSFYFSNIVDLLIQSYELSISCLFVPILFALLGIRNSARVAAVSMIGGALGFVLFRFVETALPRELLSIVLSFAAYAIGHLLLNSQKSQIEER